METDTITDHASTTLARLLDDELALSPSFQGIYSNHLAMSLVALDQLGAPPDVLQATFDAHLNGEPEWRDDREALEARRQEVARDGIEAAVRAHATGLVDGPGTALFHPVIRLGYALDVGHPGQVAAALLDWERRHEALPVPEPSPGSRRLMDVAADLADRPVGTWRHSFDLGGIARRPELGAALVGVALDEHTLDDVSSFAIAAHIAADDFITLHLVTGARAVRTAAHWLDGDVAARLVARTLPVLAVAYAAVGAPRLLGAAQLDGLRRFPLPLRALIAERAIADRDPHVIKLANVALAEEERTSDAIYRYAAARVVGLVPPVHQLVERL
jgi:hypothetical protein